MAMDPNPDSHMQSLYEPIERSVGTPFRPRTFDEFIGNEAAKQRLQIAIQAATKESRMPPHILLYGNAGVGKTTLAQVVANALQAHAHVMVGGLLKGEKDLLKILADFQHRQEQGQRVLLVIDEVHLLSRGAIPQESYFTVLEDFKFFHNLKGEYLEHTGHTHPEDPWATNGHRHEILSERLTLQPFTVLGMTTDPSWLSIPLRDRFGVSVRLEEYTLQELTQIIQLHASHRIGLQLNDVVAQQLADRARGNPRVGINLLKECYDRSIVEDQPLSDTIILKQCDLMGILVNGFTRDDVKYLLALASNIKGLSLGSIASMIRIYKATIEEMIEPFLRFKGFCHITNRRHITQTGMQFLIDRGFLSPLPQPVAVAG